MHIPHCAPKTNKVTSTVSEETKIISPTIIIQQLTDWKEYTVMHAKGTTLLPANVHLIQKKKKNPCCDTLTYLMALQSTFVERVSERKNKYQISTYITKSTYFRVTTYSCRLKEGGSSQQNGAYRHILIPDEATPVKVHTSQETSMRVPSADFEAFRTCICRSTYVFPTVVTVASLAAQFHVYQSE